VQRYAGVGALAHVEQTERPLPELLPSSADAKRTLAQSGPGLDEGLMQVGAVFLDHRLAAGQARGAGVLHVDESAQGRTQIQLPPETGAGLEVAAGVLSPAAEALVVAVLGAEAQLA